MKEKLKKKEGITLIALVLTIIVLLILAGVSIATLTGENGILTKAQTAKTETEKASEGERKDIEELEELLSNETVVEQVTDKNPGQLEEENEEKVINSIEDLVVFASKVTGGETYEGKTVKLGLSLDFNSVKSYVNPYRTDYEKYGYNGELKTLLTSGEGFKPIGITTNEEGYENKSFSGTFDGNGKIIYNLLINKNVEDNKNDLVIGLFGSNYGTIKKLGVKNCNNSGNLTTNAGNTCLVGGITGGNHQRIEECFVSGDVLSICSAKSRCGGICAVSADSSASIKDCYNLATINCTGGNDANVAGGIAGNSVGNLANCFNNGKILMKCDGENGINYVGGIVGYVANESAKVKNCYNLNSVVLDINSSNVTCSGGIVGDFIKGSLNNCHNKGNIDKLNLNNEKSYIGLILGLISTATTSDVSLSNCSSLKFNNYKWRK